MTGRSIAGSSIALPTGRWGNRHRTPVPPRLSSGNRTNSRFSSRRNGQTITNIAGPGRLGAARGFGGVRARPTPHWRAIRQQSHVQSRRRVMAEGMAGDKADRRKQRQMQRICPEAFVGIDPPVGSDGPPTRESVNPGDSPICELYKHSTPGLNTPFRGSRYVCVGLLHSGNI